MINALMEEPQELTTADVLNRLEPSSLNDRFGLLGSAAMTRRGPWMRQYLPDALANFLASALQYAPMGLGSRGGVGVGRDAIMAHRMNRPNEPGQSHIMDPGVTGESVLSAMEIMYPGSTRALGNPDRSNGMVAYPEEVQLWARQTPANISDAAAMRRAPNTGALKDGGRDMDPAIGAYRDAQLMQARKRDQGKPSNRPFDVIPGDKQ